jgi:hypothetical protein
MLVRTFKISDISASIAQTDLKKFSIKRSRPTAPKEPTILRFGPKHDHPTHDRASLHCFVHNKVFCTLLLRLDADPDVYWFV